MDAEDNGRLLPVESENMSLYVKFQCNSGTRHSYYKIVYVYSDRDIGMGISAIWILKWRSVERYRAPHLIQPGVLYSMHYN